MKRIAIVLALLLAASISTAQRWPEAQQRRCDNPMGMFLNPDETQNIFQSLVDNGTGTTGVPEAHWVAPVDVLFHSLYAEVNTAPGGSDQWGVRLCFAGTSCSGVITRITGAATVGVPVAGSTERVVNKGVSVSFRIGDNGTTPIAATELYYSFCINEI